MLIGFGSCSSDQANLARKSASRPREDNNNSSAENPLMLFGDITEQSMQL